jgi:hypothetical protein
MYPLSETLKSVGDWFGSRLDQLLSLLRIDLRRRTITYEASTGTMRVTEFGLKVGGPHEPRVESRSERDKPPRAPPPRGD